MISKVGMLPSCVCKRCEDSVVQVGDLKSCQRRAALRVTITSTTEQTTIYLYYFKISYDTPNRISHKLASFLMQIHTSKVRKHAPWRTCKDGRWLQGQLLPKQ